MYLSVFLGACIVLVIVLVALFGWGGILSLTQRLSLAAIAAGIVWAGPGRALGREPGPGDALLLIGVLVYLIATYGPRMFQRLDGLDGAVDGRIDGPFSIEKGRVAAKHMEVDRLRAKTARERGRP
jgi:drug/metabolite transporter (DMT)-like permease